MRVFDAGNHEISLLSIGYWGHSHEGNLVPIGYGVQVNDTIDPRRQDQTHTAVVALNDVWKLDSRQDLQFSGFFRTYNLSLFSDLGLGLIRQSEFRTVTGGSAGYVNKITNRLTLLAGMDYEREAPRGRKPVPAKSPRREERSSWLPATNSLATPSAPIVPQSRNQSTGWPSRISAWRVCR